MPTQSPKAKRATLPATVAASGSLFDEHADVEQSRPTKAVLLEKAGSVIAAQPPSDEDLSFQHVIMCQVGLPRSRVDGIEYERRSGGSALYLRAGRLWDGKEFVQQQLPYGTLPRLALGWMNTYAVRNNTPEIPLCNSASQFLRVLGKGTNGGRNGAFTTFRTQMQALAACQMQLGQTKGDRATTFNGQPIRQFDAWLTTVDNQPSLWPGVLYYSTDYFNTLIEHAVPYDYRAMAALQDSALSMDVYVFLAERLHRIEGNPLFMTWRNLRDQFGQEYTGEDADKNFKKRFLQALVDTLKVYPKAVVKQVRGGLMLYPSAPPVPEKL